MNKLVEYPLEIAAGCAAFLVASAAVYMPFVAADARKGYHDSCDYLMILGGDIIGADTPSPQLFERMKAAAAYLNENKNVIAVPCGGCFRKGQKKSEARVITDYLVSHGIDESRIILEEKSTTTFENFEFAIEIIEKYSKKNINDIRVAFLSSTYHMHRAGLIAERCGISSVLRVSCITPGKAFKRYIREYFVAYEFPKRKVVSVFDGIRKKIG